MPALGPQLVRDLALAADRDLEGRTARVRDRERRAAELADHSEVGPEPVLAEEVGEVLAAPAGRLVHPDRDDHELARERPSRRDHARSLCGTRERALHVRGAAPVDRFAVDARRLVRNRNRVEMAVEDDRRAGPVALQPPEDDWRRREALVEELDLQPDFLEPPPVEPRDLGRVAGRALDLDELQGQVAQAIGVDAHMVIMTFPRA